MHAAPTTYEFEVFHDGACPLCAREIRMLQRRDRHGRIRFTDISAPDFDAASVGVTWEALMARIHGRLPDGTVVEGVEVFRRLYTAIGFGSVVALTRLPGIRHLLDLAYVAFAKNRLRLTGRCIDDACDVHARPGADIRSSPRSPTGSVALADMRPFLEWDPSSKRVVRGESPIRQQ